MVDVCRSPSRRKPNSVASFRIRTRADGSSYTAVLWREDGKQTSLSFDDHKAALSFKALLEQSGPEKATEVYGAKRKEAVGHTLGSWCAEYIDGLTGIEDAHPSRSSRSWYGGVGSGATYDDDGPATGAGSVAVLHPAIKPTATNAHPTDTPTLRPPRGRARPSCT